jgi:hypothetical protein
MNWLLNDKILLIYGFANLPLYLPLEGDKKSVNK